MKNLRLCLLGAAFALLNSSFAQVGYSLNTLSDGNGNAVLSKKATAGEATYLFNKNYQEGVLYLEGNTKGIGGAKYKLNLKDNKLFFQNADGDEMEVTSPVARVEFTGLGAAGADIVFVRGLPPVGKLTKDTYYQLLVAGKALLLQNTEFAEVEYKEYNSATTAHRTDKLVSYYGVLGNQLVKLSKPEDVLLLLGDKTQQLSDYIKKENIRVKKQADLEKLFRYYNSL